jgi:hypothetical protein
MLTLPARLALNYKKIDYKTEWIEYPDLASKYKELYVVTQFQHSQINHINNFQQWHPSQRPQSYRLLRSLLLARNPIHRWHQDAGLVAHRARTREALP